MPETSPKTGERFSLNYLRSDDTLRDDDRMRFRMSHVFDAYTEDRRHSRGSRDRFGNLVEREIGIRVFTHTTMGKYVDFEKVFRDCKVHDLLDMITLLYRLNRSQELIKETRRIFAETQVGYRIDDEGGVHPAFDDAFEAVRASAIQGLSGPGFEAVRGHIEATENALMSDPFDGRQAVRSIFDALEHLFKAMYAGSTQLNAASIRNKLRDEVEQKYPGEGRNAAKHASLKQVDSFTDWVDSAHFYRHASGQPDPHQPPEELTILVVSQGLSFIRWLTKIKKSRA